MTILALTLPVVKPVRSRPGRRAIAKPEMPFAMEQDAVDVVCSRLPDVSGYGLTDAERTRLVRAENIARSQYAADCPDADSIEIHRVGAAAARDALRAVLRDRPVAKCEIISHLPAGADEHMTEEELVILEELNRLNPAGALEAELERYPSYLGWPAITDNWRWVETPAEEPRIALAELIDLEAGRLRDRGNDAGDLMAGALEELARVVRVVSATRPDQVEERLSILEDDYTAPVEFEPELMPSGRWA